MYRHSGHDLHGPRHSPHKWRSCETTCDSLGPVRLRVVTLNVWALPLGAARDVSARMAAIGSRLSELAADVVALQEVWTLEARDSLLSAGRRAG